MRGFLQLLEATSAQVRDTGGHGATNVAPFLVHTYRPNCYLAQHLAILSSPVPSSSSSMPQAPEGGRKPLRRFDKQWL